MHDHQLFPGQDLSRLYARMVRPWSDRIELERAHQRSQSAAAFASALISQRQVVVRVGVLRHQPYRLAVGFDRIRQALQLVEHVSQIKKRQRISWIGDGGTAVKLLRPTKDATVVADRPEID